MILSQRSYERVGSVIWGAGLAAYLTWSDVSVREQGLSVLTRPAADLLDVERLQYVEHVVLSFVRYSVSWSLPLLLFAAVAAVLVVFLSRS